VEVYVDDFMSLMILVLQEQLQHGAMAVMMGIHDVFPLEDNDSNNPISERKLIKDEGLHSTQKMILALTSTAWQRQCGLNGQRGRSSLLFLRAGCKWVQGVWLVYLSKSPNWSWQNFGMHLHVSRQEWGCYHHATGSSNSTQPLCICTKLQSTHCN
jgi:hypothetical protein